MKFYENDGEEQKNDSYVLIRTKNSILKIIDAKNKSDKNKEIKPFFNLYFGHISNYTCIFHLILKNLTENSNSY